MSQSHPDVYCFSDDSLKIYSTVLISILWLYSTLFLSCWAVVKYMNRAGNNTGEQRYLMAADNVCHTAVPLL